MRKFFTCLTALFFLLGLSVTMAQRPSDLNGSLQKANATPKNAPLLRTSGAINLGTGSSTVGLTTNPTRATLLHNGPAFSSNTGPGTFPTASAACGPDTVYYPLAKATGFQIIGISDSVNVGQMYEAPQSLTISGVSFYAWVDSATNQSVTLQIRLYQADVDTTPLGAPLRTATISVDSNFYGGSLPLLLKHVTFSTPLTTTNDYIVTIENNNSSIPVSIVTNDYTAIPPDGANEWLGCVYLPAPLSTPSSWLNARNISIGGAPYNADLMVFPHVSYTLNAGIATPLTGCVGGTTAMTNTSSPILFSRFYNQLAFFGIPGNGSVWNYGDGSPIDSIIDGSHAYSTAGSYTVSLQDSIIGWTTVCTETVTATATISTGASVGANYGYSTAGLVASFSDNSTGSPNAWTWDFGDGNTSTSQNPSHTYTSNGIYTVCLIATNNCGADTTCQQVLVGPPPPASCDTLGNITGTPTLYGSPATFGWVNGHNVFGDSAKAEDFSGLGTFSFEEALYWFAFKRSSTPTTSQILARVWDSNGPGGTPGTVLRTQPVTYNNIDTTAGALTSVTFSPPIVTNNDFYVGFEMIYGPGDTVALVSNQNGQTIPGTAWEKDSSGVWGSIDTSWGLDISLAIWVVQRVAAGFSSSTAGLTANFTDASEGAIAWLWDFGDGNTSTQQNPTHTYAVAGTYTVCQVAFNGTCNDTVCQTVTVSAGCPTPTAAFNFTGTPTVNFTNTSSTTGSSVTYAWDFGDGNSSNAMNPTHTYASAGTYTVCLGVLDSCGVDSVCQTVTISCVPPVAAYTASTVNTTASFTDGSTGSPTSWIWSFGDGFTSSAQNPTHTYATPGNYNVCLLVTNGCGTDSICQPLIVTCPAPTAAYVVDSISNDTAYFSDASTGSGLSWFWDFGDGNTSTLQNPNHGYSAPGYYTVCLGVTDSCGTDTICTTILVGCPPPTAAFTWITTGLQVDFTDASVTLGSSITWAWDFGDGNTSTAQNPTHTYATADTFTVCLIVSDSCSSDTICQDVITGCNTPLADWSATTAGLDANFTDLTTNTPLSWFWDFGDGNTSTQQNPTHSYAVQGTYIVCLTATNGCGSNTFCDTVTIVCPPPVAAYTATSSNLTVNFTDVSSGTPVQWAWDFGDGSPIVTTQNPSHTYTTPGTYLVCFGVANACGFDSTCQFVTVTCASPTSNFGFTVSGFSANFTDNSTGGATSWAWDFGDGNSSTVQNPSHTYGAAGSYTVCLTVTNSCGSNTFCQTVVVNCPAPAPNFSFTQINQFFQFADLSSGGVTSWAWDFGDGNTSSTQNPSHTYATPGTYNVCLTVTNSCGSATFCQPVNATCPIPVALFTNSNANLVVSFTDASTNSPNTWVWDFGDGTNSLLQNPTHTYAVPGSYTVCLIALNGCGSDTTCFPINVTCPAPSAGFQFLTVGNNIDFTDISTGGATSWMWDFGDGTTSNAQNPSHSYTSTGTFNVCLIASSICGADTFCQSVIISCVPPTAGFSSSVTDSIATFINNSSANSIAYTWTFGDGGTSTAVNPTHTYSAPGTYTVCLVVSNTCGLDTICQTVTITCTNPTAGYTVSINNQTATFTDVSLLPATWTWDFGDGNTSNAQSPVHSYSSPGTYTVCLTVENFCGTNTTCQNLIIACNPPDPNFSYANGVGTVNFTDGTANNPTRWLWNFGDGTTDTVQNPQHGYLFPGSFWVCLRAWNSCGRADTCMWVTVTTIGVEDGLFGTSLEIFPNPNSGQFTLRGEVIENTDLEIAVVNVLGEQLWYRDERNLYGTFTRSIDLGNVAKGVYFLELKSGDRRIVRKIVVE